jgi:DNA repair and recombination protein RAD54B
MMSFVRPHLLGPQGTFQRVFIAPIEASQETGASADCKDLGRAREAELSRQIQPFLLRRTADVNSKCAFMCKAFALTRRLTPPGSKSIYPLP